MATRRAFLAGGSTIMAVATMPDASAASHLTTSDGYSPPKASQGFLAKVRFDKADRIGKKYTDRFTKWDKHVGDRRDPSNCRGLYAIPNGTKKPVIFWESKMAVDTDGASHIPGDDTGTHQGGTSLMFKHGGAIDALTVPYFVVPSPDVVDSKQKIFPDGPWEDSGDSFERDLNVTPGNLGVVIFAGNITGALFADTGPAMKIGEASIRVHELIRGPQHPWEGPVPRKKLNGNDGAGGKVLYLIFRDRLFDIETFGPQNQGAMAEAIQIQGLEAFRDFIAAQG